MKKQHISQCLAEYTDKELVDFHGNINALFLCCSTDFKLLPLLLHIQDALSERKTEDTIKYLKAVDKMLQTPAEHSHN